MLHAMTGTPTEAPRLRRFSVHEYYDMARAGILGTDERVELLDGQVIRMTPKGSRQAACISVLAELFGNQVPDSAKLRIQLPLRVHSFSEPVPDLALVKARSEGYWDRHPGPDDTLLVVEVSESSLYREGGVGSGAVVKLAMYAEAGVPEVWIVDLAWRKVEVFRGLRDGRFTAVERLGLAQKATPTLVQGARISLSDIIR